MQTALVLLSEHLQLFTTTPRFLEFRFFIYLFLTLKGLLRLSLRRRWHIVSQGTVLTSGTIAIHKVGAILCSGALLDVQEPAV